MHNLVNNLKTAGLLAALLALFLIVGYQFGTGGLIIGLIFGLVTNFGAWYFSDTIAIRAMQGREIGPDSGRIAGVDTRRIYESVVRLSRRAELPMPPTRSPPGARRVRPPLRSRAGSPRP